jgi:hypothetical protein
MARFCTRCGTKTEVANARFCDACGAPLPGTPVAAAPTAHSQPTPLPLGKIVKFGSIAVAVLALLGGGVWWLTKAPSLPDASDLSALLNADQAATEQRVCLDNFDYAKNPVTIAQYDTNTKQWLDALAVAGVYSPAQTVTSGGGWFSQTQYRYTQTAAGLKAVRNGKLCFASGIALDKVSYSKPEKRADKTFAEARYTYHYSNPAAWVSQPAIAKAEPARLGKTSFDDSAVLMLDKDKWQLVSAQDLRETQAGQSRNHALFDLSMLGQGAPDAESATATPPAAGLFDSIKRLFSGFGGNPILGKWGANGSVVFEFTPTQMIAGGQAMPVKYDVQDKNVHVSVMGQQGVTFTVIDNDHIAMDAGMVKLQLTRVN